MDATSFAGQTEVPRRWACRETWACSSCGLNCSQRTLSLGEGIACGLPLGAAESPAVAPSSAGRVQQAGSVTVLEAVQGLSDARAEDPAGGSRSGHGGDPAGASAVPSEPIPFSIHEHKDGGACGVEGYGEIFQKRVGRYGRGKSRGQDLADWIASERAAGRADRRMTRAGDKLAGCGSYLEFRAYLTLPEFPVRLHSASFCQQPRLCGLCAIRRSAKLLRAYAPKLCTIVASGKFPYLLTLTAKNGEDLAERYQHLDGALRKSVEQGRVVRRGRVKYWHPWALLAGGVFSYEFKRGEGTRGGGWHPHAHGVVVTDQALEVEEAVAIRRAWAELLEDADIRAQDIRLLKSVTPEMIGEQLLEAAGADLVEVFKYPMKFGNLTPADQWEAATSMDRRHLLRSFGCLRGVQVDPSYLDEPLDAKDLPYLRLLLKYSRDKRTYHLAERIFIDVNL